MITVDRIEGEWAVLCMADETTRAVPIYDLPPDVRAGDVLVAETQGWRVDKAATEALRERAGSLRRVL
ncbi:MAG: DUF3006 domain-containing protein [Ruminococcaceae bacterium]|nr:DUF3006 domain-containing protein [Oscillospiraceae bacterium]